MKLPSDIMKLLKNKFKNKHRDWLKSAFTGAAPADEWPLKIYLGVPTEHDALRQPEAVRQWIAAWRTWQGSVAASSVAASSVAASCVAASSVAASCGSSLVWIERRWRSLGTQSVPEKLLLENPDAAAVWIGEASRWSRAVGRYKFSIQRWPALADTLTKHFNVLADYSDIEFFNLCEVLSWICANPNSNVYIRQIPVSGIDSKWLESRKGLFTELIAALRNDPSSLFADRDFYRYSGLRPLPQLIRMRILDPDLRSKFAGLGDISAPAEEIAGLDITPAVTFIVENIQTGLAFNDLKNSVVIMGLGYRVDVLGKIPWLKHTRCVYWGDIDTHGFAILNRARSYLPNPETALMDEATLLSHRALWVEEKDQHSSNELPLLTDSELTLFQSLKKNKWGHHIRLEQERIRWDEAWDVLRTLYSV